MKSNLHHSFATSIFDTIVAHDGKGEVQWCRTQQGYPPNINFIDITILPPGTSIGVHTHPMDNTEIYVIISGAGRMLLDGEWFEVGPGHITVNRPGGTHALENTGDTELRLIVIELAMSDEACNAAEVA